jgi:hypothetical protein
VHFFLNDAIEGMSYSPMHTNCTVWPLAHFQNQVFLEGSELAI